MPHSARLSTTITGRLLSGSTSTFPVSTAAGKRTCLPPMRMVSVRIGLPSRSRLRQPSHSIAALPAAAVISAAPQPYPAEPNSVISPAPVPPITMVPSQINPKVRSVRRQSDAHLPMHVTNVIAPQTAVRIPGPSNQRPAGR